MKRYDCVTSESSNHSTPYGKMVEDAAGEYVRHEDVEEKLEVLDQIVTYLVDEGEWSADSVDTIFHILERAGLLKADDQGYAVRADGSRARTEWYREEK